MLKGPSVLLGGVPFGCDNVGDEAILECAVRIFREVCPRCELTVATGDPRNTSAKLDVRTCELLGFVPAQDPRRLESILREHDVFVWCGATGLSDYPETPARLMLTAQRAGLKTIVWGVGMNDELNPALYRLTSGRRRAVLTWLRRGSFGLFDAVGHAERRRARRARAAIAQSLNAADLVVARDPETKEEIRRCGATCAVTVGADSALTLDPEPVESISLPSPVRRLLEMDMRKIGVCISAQRRVTDRTRLIETLNRLCADNAACILFIPMNPITDAELMRDLHAGMAFPERAALLEGRYAPAEVLAVTAQMNLIVSSRLHLLIFASLADVPMIGVSRGSKVDSFLRPMGLKSAGSAEECDFAFLEAEATRLLEHSEEFAQTCRENRSRLLDRLTRAKQRLRETIAP
ncbi:MAG TPA: polysaccharide pyruvyl transferase family protein [Candidatus Hydrogenedentes bacterium]|nr:polysaccharide pyruvyl transferase family protein [Candidatus Hydrogenedentota bacterium]HOS02426.1 polysaccharide pyruvyl transferase family protein [Candidatus Hydrogenedentota bacterium]